MYCFKINKEQLAKVKVIVETKGGKECVLTVKK